MKINDLERACLQIFKNNAPVRTGVLKGQIRIEKTSKGFDIISDIYYMEYTEEKWEYNSRWGYTGINPNEGWFRTSFEQCMRLIGNVKGVEFIRES